MSDEEEDYMSDAFLAKLEKNDVRPSLIRNQAVKRKNELESNRKKEAKMYKPVHVIQKELMKEGLNKALTEDNKGFAMLAKMGFKPGTSLGKSSNCPQAIKEPIKVNINNVGRSGLGTETAAKVRIEQELEKLKKKMNSSNLSAEEFRQQLREQNETRQVFFDLHKLQKTCRIIDLEHAIRYPIHPFFWPEEKAYKDDDKEEDDDTPPSSLDSLSVS